MTKIRVMSYNIEKGGLSIYKKTGNMDYVNKYINLIKSHRIDIVSFQECKMRDLDISKIIAKKLGYHHQYFFDKTNYYKNKYYHQSTISRFPITSVDEKSNLCRVDINGTLVNIVNIHLDDEPYIPYSLKGIKYPNTPQNVVNKSDAADLSFVSKRDLIQLIMSDKMITDNPTIIMGDFNEPSYLDYKYIKWKTSKYILKNGFVDVARQIYENATKYPLYTVDLYDKKYSPERIDIMYCNKGLKPVNFTNIYNNLSDHVPIVGVIEIVSNADTGKADTGKAETKKINKNNNNKTRKNKH